MTPCPHCQSDGVPLSAKRRSSREHPAVCSLCGRLSHVIASTSSGIFLLSLLIVGTFYWIGAINEVTLVGWLGVPVAVAYYRWAWQRAELWPITGDSAKTSRQASRIVNALGVHGIFWF